MSGGRKELKRRRNKKEQLLIGRREISLQRCVLPEKGKDGSCEEDPREHGEATEQKWPRSNGRTREKEK
jgi:hypothetical protein